MSSSKKSKESETKDNNNKAKKAFLRKENNKKRAREKWNNIEQNNFLAICLMQMVLKIQMKKTFHFVSTKLPTQISSHKQKCEFKLEILSNIFKEYYIDYLCNLESNLIKRCNSTLPEVFESFVKKLKDLNFREFYFNELKKLIVSNKCAKEEEKVKEKLFDKYNIFNITYKEKVFYNKDLKLEVTFPDYNYFKHLYEKDNYYDLTFPSLAKLYLRRYGKEHIIDELFSNLNFDFSNYQHQKVVSQFSISDDIKLNDIKHSQISKGSMSNVSKLCVNNSMLKTHIGAFSSGFQNNINSINQSSRNLTRKQLSNNNLYSHNMHSLTTNTSKLITNPNEIEDNKYSSNLNSYQKNFYSNVPYSRDFHFFSNNTRKSKISNNLFDDSNDNCSTNLIIANENSKGINSYYSKIKQSSLSNVDNDLQAINNNIKLKPFDNLNNRSNIAITRSKSRLNNCNLHLDEAKESSKNINNNIDNSNVYPHTEINEFGKYCYFPNDSNFSHNKFFFRHKYESDSEKSKNFCNSNISKNPFQGKTNFRKSNEIREFNEFN